MQCENEEFCLDCDVCKIIESELPKIKCGRCNQMTWEVHGEWISSYGRHELIGHCLVCDRPELME